jgi:hypothetical protein
MSGTIDRSVRPLGGGIAYNGRTLAIGMTRSGKSELINVQFSAMRCQRALYDSKGEFAIPDVPIATDVAAIDWRQPVVHFRPGEDARGDAQAFFAAAFDRPNALIVAVHELGDLCDYNANGAPASVKRYFVQGGALGKGALCGTQRPVGIPKQAYTEAGDFFIFVPRLTEDDLAGVAREMGLRTPDLSAKLDAVQGHLGEHAFLRYSRRTRELVACPPLPAHVRKTNTVQRVHDAPR